MAIYTIGTPDGRRLRIEAPDEATAIRGAQEWSMAQAQQPAPDNSQPPAGAVPGSPQYAQWAAQRAREQVAAGERPSLPKVSVDPNSAQMTYNTALERVRRGQFPEMTDAQWADYSKSILAPVSPTQQGMAGSAFGFGDEIAGGVAGVGSGLRQFLGGGGPGAQQTFQDVQQLEEARLALGREQNGLLGGALETVGSMAAIGPGRQLMAAPVAAPAALTRAELAKTALQSGGTGAVLGGLQGFGTASGGVDERLQGAGAGATAGAIIGAAAPVVSEAIRGGITRVADSATRAAQRQLTNQAIQGAPDAAALKQAASAMFQQVDNSGVSIDPVYFGGRILQMAQKAGTQLIDQELDAPAYRMYQILADRIRMAQEAGRGLTLGEVHNLRQIAQDVAMGAGKGRTARFATEMIDELDNIMANLKPNQLVGGTGTDKGNVLLQGISTWSRARKVGLIEEALYKAQNQASGLENGLRIQFRALLQNPKTRRLFSQAEIDEIQRVVQGTTTANLLKLIGRFGFGSGNASNMLGGSIGTTIGGALGAPLGPVGTAAGAALIGGGATLARRGSEALTNQAAQRAAQVIATPNIPQAQQVIPPQRINDLLRGIGLYGGPLGVSATN